VSPRFKRDDLRQRYDVSTFDEDDWHAYSGERTSEYVEKYLTEANGNSRWLLNAGSGVYEFRLSDWKEVTVDLFTTPLATRTYPTCATIEKLPFRNSTFAAVVCVGEVLGYCDPVAVFTEFARVVESAGLIICDFGSSRSFRHLLTESYGRAADIVVDYYNRTPERVWVYDPKYISQLLSTCGFEIIARLGIHTWSSLARRVGLQRSTALAVEKTLRRFPLTSIWADLTTIVAVRT
jgi:SAM-dependent methyltransferase